MSWVSSEPEALIARHLEQIPRRSPVFVHDWVVEQCRIEYPVEQLPKPADLRASTNQATSNPGPWRSDRDENSDPLLSLDRRKRKAAKKHPQSQDSIDEDVPASSSDPIQTPAPPPPPLPFPLAPTPDVEKAMAPTKGSASKQKTPANHLDAARKALRERQANNPSAWVTASRVTQPLASTRLGILNKGAASKPLAIGGGATAFSEDKFLGEREEDEAEVEATEEPQAEAPPTRTAPRRSARQQAIRSRNDPTTRDAQQVEPAAEDTTSSDAQHSAYSNQQRKKNRERRDQAAVEEQLPSPSASRLERFEDFLDMGEASGSASPESSPQHSPELSAWRGSAWRLMGEDGDGGVDDDPANVRATTTSYQDKEGLIFDQPFDPADVAHLYSSPRAEHAVNAPESALLREDSIYDCDDRMDFEGGEPHDDLDGHVSFQDRRQLHHEQEDADMDASPSLRDHGGIAEPSLRNDADPMYYDQHETAEMYDGAQAQALLQTHAAQEEAALYDAGERERLPHLPYDVAADDDFCQPQIYQQRQQQQQQQYDSHQHHQHQHYQHHFQCPIDAPRQEPLGLAAASSRSAHQSHYSHHSTTTARPPTAGPSSFTSTHNANTTAERPRSVNQMRDLQQALRGAVDEVEHAKYPWQFDDQQHSDVAEGEGGLGRGEGGQSAAAVAATASREGFWAPQALRATRTHTITHTRRHAAASSLQATALCNTCLSFPFYYIHMHHQPD